MQQLESPTWCLPYAQQATHKKALEGGGGDMAVGLLGVGKEGGVRGLQARESAAVPWLPLLLESKQRANSTAVAAELFIHFSLHAYLACAGFAKIEAVCLAHVRQACFEPGELSICAIYTCILDCR